MLILFIFYMPKLRPEITIYNLWPGLTDYTRKKLRGYSVTFHDQLTDKTLEPRTEILAVFIESPVTKELMQRMPKLKCIVTMSTGFDHIDLKAATKLGITVCNVPTYGENTVAEHTFALILGLTRQIFDSVKRVKEGSYDFHGLRGTDLSEKTIGIIGTGHIGTHVARIAKGFAMNVLAYDKFPNKQVAATLGFTYVPLKKLLTQSDVVTLHTPLFKDTYHLINKKNIKLMKRGSFLINTARGGLVEAEALLAALNSGLLAGAGLDVLEDENLLQHFEEVMHANQSRKLTTSLINNLLIDHPKTIVTPHNAFNSSESLQRIIDVTIKNITGFVTGTIINQVRTKKPL